MIWCRKWSRERSSERPPQRERWNRRAIKDLVAPGRFLLIAGEDGEPWCTAAQELVADTNVPLDAVRIGDLDGDLYDSRCAWLRHRRIQTDGAILVRPDRFIGWRAPSSAENPRRELATALSQILGRPIDADVLAGVASIAT